MITNENKKLAQWAMEYALKNGCQSSRVTLYNGSSSSFEIRDMKIDRLQQASENSMVVHLFVDGRYGSYSTNRLDKKELEKFIKDGIAATRFLAEDKARTLPDASLYYKGGAADLRLVDPNFDSVQPDDKVALAMSVCEEIMGKDDRIISANASIRLKLNEIFGKSISTNLKPTYDTAFILLTLMFVEQQVNDFLNIYANHLKNFFAFFNNS